MSTDESFAEVPFPPPTVEAEIIPPQPVHGSVWKDGEWSWDGRQWGWSAGSWLKPPAGAVFFPWRVHYDTTGHWRFQAAHWRDSAGRPLPNPPPLAPAAAAPPGEAPEG
jgi:hypothetical protein